MNGVDRHVERPWRTGWQQWRLPLLLFAATLVSTLHVGASMAGAPPRGGLLHVLAPARLARGWPFAGPLMAILLSHEMGHYVMGRLRGVDVSPPYFVPVPFFLMGTAGAVIRIRSRIRSPNALFDVGAAGPLAGLLVALPVLVYGLATSPVEPLKPSAGGYLVEGRSLLYLALLRLVKGPIPDGSDILLTPTAFAGWAGLLVTAINLLPVGELDGGHVAYAMFGPAQDTYSERLRKALPAVALLVGLYYGGRAWVAGKRGEALLYEGLAGIHWLVWAVFLKVIVVRSGGRHPPTDPGERLTPGRRRLGWFVLALFVALFMPSWLRVVPPGAVAP